MSEQQWKALSEAMANDETLRHALESAADQQEFARIANEAGFQIEIADVEMSELSDAELETVSGGYTFPRTDWIYCDNPWTNYWCTLKC